LDFGLPPSAEFSHFIVGENQELLTQLTTLKHDLVHRAAADRTFYLWGDQGSGRTHLLHALCHPTQSNAARFICPQDNLDAFTFNSRIEFYALDDCEKLSPIQQIAAFNLFNEVHAHPGTAFIAAGNAPPLDLSVREDLRTRLGWGLIFQVLPLSEADKIIALEQAAHRRGFMLSFEVCTYLLTHFKRDMPSLMELLDALDHFSLEKKRAITLPLLREMLNCAYDDSANFQ
jgi:DnaA family protein